MNRHRAGFREDDPNRFCSALQIGIDFAFEMLGGVARRDDFDGEFGRSLEDSCSARQAADRCTTETSGMNASNVANLRTDLDESTSKPSSDSHRRYANQQFADVDS